MPAYSDSKSVHVSATQANVVDTITITGGYAYIDVLNRDASSPIYAIAANGSTPPNPAVAGNGTEYVGPGGFVRFQGGAGTTTVKVISTGTVPYSIIGVSF